MLNFELRSPLAYIQGKNSRKKRHCQQALPLKTSETCHFYCWKWKLRELTMAKSLSTASPLYENFRFNFEQKKKWKIQREQLFSLRFVWIVEDWQKKTFFMKLFMPISFFFVCPPICGDTFTNGKCIKLDTTHNTLRHTHTQNGEHFKWSTKLKDRWYGWQCNGMKTVSNSMYALHRDQTTQIQLGFDCFKFKHSAETWNIQ